LPRAFVVRHEDLVVDPEGTLRGLDAHFGVHHHRPFMNVTSDAYALDWDHMSELRGVTPFDRSYYAEKKYLRRLSPEVREAVKRTIVWERIGYEAG
jgi:hypothetical protein